MSFQKEISSFRESLDSDEWRGKISKIVSKYNIDSYETSVYYNFDKEKPVLQIEPDDESFRRIIHKYKPKEVEYFGVVSEYDQWDPEGRRGTMKFNEDENIVISSNQYVFGEKGVFENYENLGYQKEERKGKETETDINHYFVLLE